jgi:hypothetical protein
MHLSAEYSICKHTKNFMPVSVTQSRWFVNHSQNKIKIYLMPSEIRNFSHSWKVSPFVTPNAEYGALFSWLELQQKEIKCT